MSEYVNGFQINVSDIARIRFMEQSQFDGTTKPVTEVVMQYESLKALHENLGSIIEQHDDKLASLKKSN